MNSKVLATDKIGFNGITSINSVGSIDELERIDRIENVGTIGNIGSVKGITKEKLGSYVVVEEPEVTALRINKKEHKILKYVNSFVKRIIDIIGGIVGILILIPLTVAVWIANRVCGDKGPVFYSQERIGKDGKVFRLYKFRSMVVGADEKLEEYLKWNEVARREYSINKKLKHDPRITRVGNFIRKTSIDELPQLINVLKGDMSLVGCRPYLPREKQDMGTYYKIIIQDKPGVTGLWQIKGRSNTTFDERLDMDIVYYKNKSLWKDVKILIHTFVNVFKKEGAV